MMKTGEQTREGAHRAESGRKEERREFMERRLVNLGRTTFN